MNAPQPPPIDNVQIAQMPTSEFILPLSTGDAALGLVLGTAVFFYTLFQQTRIQKSVHLIGSLVLMFAVYVSFLAVQTALSNYAESGKLRRSWVVRAALQFLFIAIAFVSGLFVRLVTEPIIKGPQIGGFNFLGLLWPLTAALLFSFLFLMLSLSTTNNPAHLQLILTEEEELKSRTEIVEALRYYMQMETGAPDKHV
jgi:hypothetical protein